MNSVLKVMNYSLEQKVSFRQREVNMETSSEARYITLGTEAHQGSALLLSWSHIRYCPRTAQLSEGAPPTFNTQTDRQTCPLAFSLSRSSPRPTVVRLFSSTISLLQYFQSKKNLPATAHSTYFHTKRQCNHLLHSHNLYMTIHKTARRIKF